MTKWDTVVDIVCYYYNLLPNPSLYLLGVKMKQNSRIGRIFGYLLILGAFFCVRPIWALELQSEVADLQAVEVVSQETDNPADQEALEPNLRAALKTIAFQAVTNLSDTVMFGAITGISASTGVEFFLANSISSMAFYFPYEMAWDEFGPSQEEMTDQMYLIKTASYQVISVVRNLGLTYVFTGTLSPVFAGTVLLVDAGLYLFNEYAWDILSPRVSSTESSKHCLPQNKATTIR